MNTTTRDSSPHDPWPTDDWCSLGTQPQPPTGWKASPEEVTDDLHAYAGELSPCLIPASTIAATAARVVADPRLAAPERRDYYLHYVDVLSEHADAMIRAAAAAEPEDD